jgi:nucleotidyltransferase substrate binding protein (TIGR01987 family)
LTSNELDLSSLQKSISSLEDGLSVVSDVDWFRAQTTAVQNTLVAGVIQNFEFVYEISTKMIKRRIELDSASPEEIDEGNFRQVLRVAAEKGLIANLEAWFKYRTMRNITAHTYDHEKAQLVYQGTVSFIVDARALLKALEARNA